jgi:hypothetical protein
VAYTVGSASVDIVPDFRGAQLAITAFFNKQANELKIPVKPVFDNANTSQIEQQAARLGSRVSKAVSDAVARDQASADKLALQMAEGREKAKLRAHAEALRINAQMDRDAARAEIEAERLVSRTLKEIERDRARVEIEAAREASRAKQQLQREELNFARRSAQAINDAIKRGLAERRARIQVEVDQRRAIEAGRQTGGIVARSIDHEIHQNAGLIAAAIGGVLIAGAPAALGAATVLFGGIGAAAVSQSQQVRTAWSGTWDEIADGAKADAAVLVPVFERMAGQIGGSFQRLRPQIREAFTEVGPQLDQFTQSLTIAAETALPGIVDAVREGTPVMQGFGDLVEDIGGGVGEFFSILSGHAPAAGRAVSELGDAVGELFPLLAELLGVGAETATHVLPAVTSAFSALNAATRLTSGILPELLTAFLAFRVVQGIGRGLSNFATNMRLAAFRGGEFAGVQGRIGDTAAKAASAMPILGAVIGTVAGLMAKANDKANEWADALIAGGDAAAKARAEMADFGTAFQAVNSGFEGWISGFLGVGTQIGLTAQALDQANEKTRELEESLTPLEVAQRRADQASKDLNSALEDESVTAEELAGYVAANERAAAELTRQQEALDRATRGVTEAMAEQADQARSLVDSSFAHQEALLDLADAQTTYDDTVDEFGTGSKEAARALLELQQAMQDVVTAAGDKAFDALPASMSETQKEVLRAKAELDALNQLIADGFTLPPEMEEYRQRLIQITEQANGAMLQQAQLSAAIGELGFAVESIPGTKAIEITAPTDELKQRLIDLGFTVTEMPDGDIQVEANTEEAAGNLGTLGGLLSDLDSQVVEPQIAIDDAGFTVDTDRARGVLSWLNEQNPIPLLGLNANPFVGVHTTATGMISDIDSERPTPRLGMDTSVFQGRASDAMARSAELDSQRPSPVLGATDHATPTISSVLGLLGQMRDKTVTLTTIHREIRETVLSNIPLFNGATGGAISPSGIIPEYRYDGGGAVVGRGGPWDDLVPFRGPNPNASYRAANGEHILDGRDVALMGGQAGVYAFREMLDSGKLGGPPVIDGLRRMVASGAAPVSTGGSTRDVTIMTMDNPRAIVRAMRDEQHKHDTLALPVAWG